MPDTRYAIHGSTLTDIADAVREKRMHNNTMTPESMPNEIRSIPSGMGFDIDATIHEDEVWTRPQEWPDLDSIAIPEGFDGVYMTYDLNKAKGYGWIGVYCKVDENTSFTVERGHLSNGTFVADYSVTVPASTYYFRENLNETNGMVQLWRVYSSNHITRIGLATNSSVTAESMENCLQPMVERRGVLPYVTTLASDNGANPGYVTSGGVWLERDNLLPGGVVTSLYAMYQRCYRLEKVSLNWDVSKWKVKDMRLMFSECFRLKSVDFSTWDTSGWPYNAGLNDMFRLCISLKSIDLTPWDTSGWHVTGLQNMFIYCRSLQEIDMTGLDTSNWAVTTLASFVAYDRALKRIKGIEDFYTSKWRVNSLYYTFADCYNLEKLDLSKWNTSNWAVTTIQDMCSCCFTLKKLDISTWDTSAWAVTNMAAAFQHCYSLPELDLSKWNTSNWAVTTIESLFSTSYNIQSLDLSGWNTSNWKLATNGFRYTFYNMYSIKTIDVTGWDTSGWTITNTLQTFYQCRSLESIIGIGNWNTTNWEITSVQGLFEGCLSLKNIDLSLWNTSGWAVTSVQSMFSHCQCLEGACGIDHWDTSNWPLTSVQYLYNSAYGSGDIDLSSWDTSKFNLNSAYLMFGDCFYAEEIMFPENMSLETGTNQTYIMFGLGGALRDCNFYKVKNSNININSWNSLSRTSLLTLISKLQTTTTKRTVTIGKSNMLKLTDEEIAVATQKGWTVA